MRRPKWREEARALLIAASDPASVGAQRQVQVVRVRVAVRRRIRVQTIGLRMGSRCASGYGCLLVGSPFDTNGMLLLITGMISTSYCLGSPCSSTVDNNRRVFAHLDTVR